MKKEFAIIKQTVIIPASTDEVYEAYVDAEKQSEFTESKATGKPKVGGKFTSWDGYIFGKYLELEVGKRVVQQWETTDWAEGYSYSTLVLTFKPTALGTEITMVHSNVPAEMEEELAGGWEEFYWKPLREYFEKNRKKK